MEDKDQIDLIKDFSNANGAPGFEQEVANLFINKTSSKSNTDIDGIFNSYASLKSNTGHRPVVQLDAHADAVGFIVQAVRPNGLLKFVALGGWIPTNVPAMKVRVRNKRGEYVTGVVATKPPHFMTDFEKKALPVISDMSIDIGSLSREETINEFEIDTGCPIVPDVECEYNPKNKMFFGKDFDNRLGAAALVNMIDNLDSLPLSVDVVAALSTQEEVGLRGVHATTRKIAPDLGIVFEGCPCDDTFYPDWLAQTGLKRGPMLRDMDTSFIANPIFENFADAIANEYQIPHTRSVRTGGGVNGSVVEYYEGAPTIVVGIPVRYEHTAYNWANLEDFQNAVKLVTKIIEKMDMVTIKSFRGQTH